jgi:hypothetical protein
MSPNLVVVLLIRIEKMAKMPFAEDNDVVKTVPPDRTDEPLRIPVLPWRLSRDRSIPDTHRSEPLDESFAVSPIAIANHISRWFVPTEGFGQLTGNPLGSRVGGHTQPQKFSAGKADERWSRFFEQNFRVAKWNLCRG